MSLFSWKKLREYSVKTQPEMDGYDSRVYEYRVGLQFRREGFINPAACLFEAHFEMIISSLEKCTLRGKMSSEKCNFSRFSCWIMLCSCSTSRQKMWFTNSSQYNSCANLFTLIVGGWIRGW